MTDDRQDIPSASPTAPAKPPLSVLHLLVWIGAVAAMLALLRGTGEAVNRESAVGFGFLLLLAVYGGTAISGLLLWAARRNRGVAFPTEPGEWLWVMQGVLACVVLAIYWLRSVESFAFWLLLGFAVAVLGTIPAVRYRKHDGWGEVLFFVAGMIWEALISLAIFPVLLVFQIPLHLLFAIATISAMLEDRRKRVRRGWSHWVGVAMYIALLGAFWFIVAAILLLFATI